MFLNKWQLTFNYSEFDLGEGRIRAPTLFLQSILVGNTLPTKNRIEKGHWGT